MGGGLVPPLLQLRAGELGEEGGGARPGGGHAPAGAGGGERTSGPSSGGAGAEKLLHSLEEEVVHLRQFSMALMRERGDLALHLQVCKCRCRFWIFRVYDVRCGVWGVGGPRPAPPGAPRGHPTPYTLHPTPQTPHPTPHTPLHNPSTQNSKPSTPNPNPETRNSGVTKSWRRCFFSSLSRSLQFLESL